ncbi:MAG TPA: hypothetical protein DEW35_05880, partial [Ruminococcaceae bacterium]|nr:hypothetical protein [Oscillospiraceae bacterium]
KGDKGDKGDTGAQGIGITTVSLDDNGNLYLTYSNSETPTLLGNIKGEKGDKGDKGDKGNDGRGILKMEYNDAGELIVTYTDGTSQNLGAFSSGTGAANNGVLSFTLLSDGTYSVSAGNEIAGETEISIPSIYNNKVVSTISEGAFSNLPNLTSVIIPDTIVKIDNGAFANSTSLLSVTIPSSCTTIGNNCFEGDQNLELVVKTENLSTIGARAFVSAKSIIWDSSENTNWEFTVAQTQGYIDMTSVDAGYSYKTINNQTCTVTINDSNAKARFSTNQVFATNVNYNYYWGNYRIQVCPGNYTLTKK